MCIEASPRSAAATTAGRALSRRRAGEQGVWPAGTVWDDAPVPRRVNLRPRRDTTSARHSASPRGLSSRALAPGNCQCLAATRHERAVAKSPPGPSRSTRAGSGDAAMALCRLRPLRCRRPNSRRDEAPGRCRVTPRHDANVSTARSAHSTTSSTNAHP